MRFKPKRLPSIGSTRVKSRFLLFPKQIDGECRWLEKATWSEIYTFMGWKPLHWDKPTFFISIDEDKG